MSNLGWLFYKDYFDGLDFHNIESKKNQELILSKVDNIINYKFDYEERVTIGNSFLDLTTTYPGLLIGSGYMHELKDVEGQLILGFHFDYTSGLPIIPASSIKGVLRSAFRHIDYIQEILNIEEFEDEDIEILEKEIFDNLDDIFYDATIIKADSSNRILDEDYITPHGNNPLKNPIPLKFLKIRPSVSFRFEFDLRNSSITIAEKLLLFEQILKDLGVGAKTNVGYGQLIGDNEKRLQEQQDEISKEIEEAQREEVLKNMSPIDRVFFDNDDNIVKIIQMMQNGEILEFDTIKVELARRIKLVLQKNPKTWDVAKQKALKRKEFIELILKE